MRYALYKEVAKRPRQKRKKRKLNRGGATAGKGADGSQDSSDEEGSSDEGDDDEQPETVEREEMPQEQPNIPDQAGNQNSLWRDDSRDVQMDTVPAAAGVPATDGGVRPERYVEHPQRSSQGTSKLTTFLRRTFFFLSQSPAIPI